MTDFSLRDFLTAARVLVMKSSAEPSGMPRPLAWSFKSFSSDFSVALSMANDS